MCWHELDRIEIHLNKSLWSKWLQKVMWSDIAVQTIIIKSKLSSSMWRANVSRFIFRIVQCGWSLWLCCFLLSLLLLLPHTLWLPWDFFKHSEPSFSRSFERISNLSVSCKTRGIKTKMERKLTQCKQM